MTALILIKRESAYMEEEIIRMRRSKPDNFGSSIQSCSFIRSNMKYRGSRRYVREKNGSCNVPEMSSGDTVYSRYRKRVKRRSCKAENVVKRGQTTV